MASSPSLGKFRPQSILHWLFGNYSLYTIYTCGSLDAPLQDDPALLLGAISDPTELKHAPDPCISSLVEYAQRDAFCFGAWVDGELAAVCWFWTGETYRKLRNFWPLREHEAKLVQINTAEAFRGRGIAPRLVNFATVSMHDLGYARLLARVWHSNHPSRAMFRKAGWRQIALVVEVSPFGLKRPLRLIWPFRQVVRERENPASVAPLKN